MLGEHDFGCNYSMTFTDSHVFASFSSARGKRVRHALLVVDLQTGVATQSSVREAECDKDYDEDGGFNEVVKINDGKVLVQTNVWPDTSRILLSGLTSGAMYK